MTEFTVSTDFVVDKPTQNNRIYSRDMMEKAIAAYSAVPNQPVSFGTDEMLAEVNPTKVIGHVEEVKLDEEGRMIVKMKINDSPVGSIMKELIKGNIALSIYPTGTGYVDQDGVVTDLTLRNLYVGPKGL